MGVLKIKSPPLKVKEMLSKKGKKGKGENTLLPTLILEIPIRAENSNINLTFKEISSLIKEAYLLHT